MARIILSEAGAAAGSRFLPNGVSLFGAVIDGATLGRAVGAVAGQSIDAALFAPDRAGPRLKALHLTESREGAGIANVYGRARVGGQVIWAARFRETQREEGGGKGGPSVTRYRYSLSFAVAICEGEIQSIERIWANGEDLALSEISHRVYRGSETQEPDPLIETIEGAGQAPAYRGTAYIVFEDLPLERFGNRVPQFSLEVVKPPPPRQTGQAIGDVVEGVNIIPASGEFVYATDIIRTREFPGREQPVNANSRDGRADFAVSLDQLLNAFPGLRSAALTVGWFGDDLRAEACRVRPGVETREKVTVPWSWSVCGTDRGSAYLVSGASEGTPNYGGTPADLAVIQGIEALKAAGIEVTVSPFLFMDVPPANGLPDPYGKAEQAVFPWRGRITSETDGTAAVVDAVGAFMGAASPADFEVAGREVIYRGDPQDWGYRRFALHMAALSVAAGGVEAILLGSELRGLTHLRDADGNYPFVAALIALAEDMRTIVGEATRISYAADWTEYGAHVPADGSQDVRFPLDPLWAHEDIDFIGIDWYPPLGDWREGDAHLDALAGYRGPDDETYLLANMAGGEAFDWYYADTAARDAQARTPIIDTAHGEHWVFRTKDVVSWWNQPHHERPGGVRNSLATPWVPQSKPVRFSEIGFPAVDKGGNSPNLFFDPKSSESALPPYSTGARDDVFQTRALVTALPYFAASGVVESALVWAWDARPFPAWPMREDIWTDGGNWALGHWLNGRTGLAPLADILADLFARAGAGPVDCGAVHGLVEGYALDGVHGLRAAIEPLATAFAVDACECDGVLRFETEDAAGLVSLAPAELAGQGLSISRSLMDKSPGRVQLAFSDLQNDFEPAIAEARIAGADPRDARRLQLPLVLTPGHAGRIAERLLARSHARETAELELGLQGLQYHPAQRVDLGPDHGIWKIESVDHREALVRLSMSRASDPLAPLRSAGLPSAGAMPQRPAVAEIVIIDAPRLPGRPDDPRPLVAASAEPWPPHVDVYAGDAAEGLDRRVRIETPSVIGRLTAPLAPGPVGRWDLAASLEVEMSEPALASRSRLSVLAGANALLVETDAGWEMLTFSHAALTGARSYRLTGLLRGLQGSDVAAGRGAAAGAQVVLVDAALARADLGDHEIGVALDWRAGLDGAPFSVTLSNAQALAWKPAHLRLVAENDELMLAWSPRGPQRSDNWELPDVRLDETFEIEWTSDTGEIELQAVEGTQTSLPESPGSARVRQIGADGRAGPWSSILSMNR